MDFMRRRALSSIFLTYTIVPELILGKNLWIGRTLKALLSMWSDGPLCAVGRGTLEVYENHLGLPWLNWERIRLLHERPNLSCGQFPKWIWLDKKDLEKLKKQW